MSLDFLLIASEDPLDRRQASTSSDLALRLARSGKQVGLFLVQNGVVPARKGARWEALDALVEAGVRVQADAFSLRERGIDAAAVTEGIEPSESLAPVLDALGAQTKVLWA
jgi:predicted peroxiredoxin